MTWLIDTLIVTGALILAVLVLRRPVARWFGPGAAYALWALPLLRLFMPPLVLPAAPPLPTLTDLPVLLTVSQGTAAPIAEASGFPLTELLIALWLAGAAVFLIVRAHGYIALRRRLLADAKPVGEAKGIRLIESPAAPGPIAFGLRDKVIALPPGFMDQPDRAGRDLALAHEFEHHAARDLAVNFAMQPLLALHWFNPLAWLGWSALRRDQEAACDARVLAGRDSAERAVYGHLIARYAGAQRQQLAASLACPMFSEKPVIHRLRSLTMTEPTATSRRLGRVLLAGAALALPLTATISYAAAEEQPSAPTVAPADAPRTTRTITIIDHPEGAEIDDPKLITRTIVRDGQTIVFRSAEPVSDAEIERRVAEAVASIPAVPEAPMAPKAAMPPMAPMAPLPPEAAAPPAAPAAPRTRRVVVRMNLTSDQAAATIHGPQTTCADGGEMADIVAETGEGERREMSRVRICGHGGTPLQRLEALRKARDSISGSTSLTPDMRERVLKQLDDQIAKLSKEG